MSAPFDTPKDAKPKDFRVPHPKGELPALWLRIACFVLALVPAKWLLGIGCWFLWNTREEPGSAILALLLFSGVGALIMTVAYAASVRLSVSACSTAVAVSVWSGGIMFFWSCYELLALAGFVEPSQATWDWRLVVGPFLSAYYFLATGVCYSVLARKIHHYWGTSAIVVFRMK